MPTADFDVAIVGGGPAGSSTALHLLARRPDLAGRVVLLERAEHPREKYCAGALSAWGLDVLARLGLERAAQGTAVRALAVRAGSVVGRVEREGLGVVVRRSAFDARLFAEARARGAVTFERAGVAQIAREGGGFALDTAVGPVRARVVVGADGASGATRRALGLGEPRRRAHLYLTETEGPEPRDRVAQGTLLFDLGPVLRDGVEGYYWDFAAPLDGTPGTSRGIFHLNSAPLARADALKRSLHAHLAARGVDPAGVRLKPHAIRPFALGATLSVHGALLAGEAAGVDPVTGEGIAHALAYGELAARAVGDALRSGDLSFRDWTARVAQSFVGRHLRQACLLAPLTYGPRAALFADFLARSPAAMDLGARWYRGEPVTRAARVGLLARLAAHVARRGLALGRRG